MWLAVGVAIGAVGVAIGAVGVWVGVTTGVVGRESIYTAQKI